jgi:prevent-host-death family protein
MDVSITELRAHLSDWLDRAKSGQEVTVTDHGVPVARLLGTGVTATLERLTAEGVISRPEKTRRPTASKQPRPRSRRSVADLVGDQRR